jgi:hypothetical protein
MRLPTVITNVAFLTAASLSVAAPVDSNLNQSDVEKLEKWCSEMELTPPGIVDAAISVLDKVDAAIKEHVRRSIPPPGRGIYRPANSAPELEVQRRPLRR